MLHEPVALDADAVHADAFCLKALDQADDAFALGAYFQIEVVVIEFGMGIRLARKLKSLGDEVLAEDFVPFGFSPGTIRINGFVHNIPAVDPPSVTAHHGEDMLSHAFQ